MDKQFLNRLLASHSGCTDCPSADDVATFFDTLLGLLFPGFRAASLRNVEKLELGMQHLENQLTGLVSVSDKQKCDAKSKEFFTVLPGIYDALLEDIDAIYEGDPAANSKQEVIRSYPGFYAIAAYRVAHALQQSGVRDIPRAITEYAHSKTGIDIHPAAQIGSHFCIDHGTGVVIGETTVIGNHVKIYQGVTLGALSVPHRDVKSKRHPTLEDGVIVYSGATILGGNTIIGSGSIIGGNVWLTKSVPPHSKVYYKASMHQEGKEPDLIIVK